jgi:hypothetical protein
MGTDDDPPPDSVMVVVDFASLLMACDCRENAWVWFPSF